MHLAAKALSSHVRFLLNLKHSCFSLRNFSDLIPTPIFASMKTLSTRMLFQPVLWLTIFCFFGCLKLFGQTTVTYTQQVANYYATWTTGTAGSFNQGANQVGMFANGAGTKQVVRWRKFRTDGSGASTSDRSLQVGDQFVVTISATRANGRMGFALLANPTATASWADRENNYAISFNMDGPGTGGGYTWYAKYSGGTTSTGSANVNGQQTAYKNFTFTLTLTAPDRMNATWTDGTTTSTLNDIPLNSANPITDYSIFLDDDWDGGANRNIFWGLGAVGNQHTVTNAGSLNHGQSNGSYTIAGVMNNGLNANSTTANTLNNTFQKNGTGNVTLSAANTYLGQTQINNGELWIATGGSIAAGSGIFVGNGGQLANVAKLWLANASGGTTFTNSFTINNGNLTTREIGGLNTSGTHLFSGNITNNSTTGGLLVSTVNAGGTVNYSGVLSGAGAYIVSGSGTSIFSGTSANTYTGATSLNAGTLVLNKTAGVIAIPTNTTIASGATLRTDAANQWGTGTPPLVTINGNGVLNLNNNNQRIALASASATASVTLGTATLDINNAGTDTYAGVISGTGGLTKSNTGTQVLSGTNTYTGATTITGGILRLGAANVIADASNITLNGGTLSTGAAAGFSETVGTLNLNANSTIALGTGVHTLTFANSSAVSWAGTTLTINGWTGTGGASGTAGRIFFGNTTGTLLPAQLSRITFAGYFGTPILLPSGELVPPVQIITFTWNGSASNDWANSANWTPSFGPPAVPGASDLVIIPTSASYTNALSISGARACVDFTVNGNGTYSMAAGSSLTVSGIYTYSSSVAATFNCTSTLTISGTASSTIPAANYGNLNLAGGPRVLAGSGVIGICGNYTSTAGVLTTTGSSVNFNGTTAQSILTNAVVFNNLTISNTSAAVSSGVNVTVNGVGTINASAIFAQTAGTFAANAVATTVSGTLRASASGVVTGTAANLIFAAGGTYDHNRDGGVIPTATWNTTSTCLITGTVATAPTGFNGQTLGNWTWNTPGLTSGTLLTGTNNPTQINGTWTISGTNNIILDFTGINRTYNCDLVLSGNSRLSWNRGAVAATSTITVNNFTTTAVPTTTNSLFINNNSSASPTTTFTVLVNVLVNAASGTAIVWTSGGAGQNAIFRVGGDFTVTSGGLSGGGGSAISRLRFINAGIKNYSATTTVSLTSVEVDGGTLNINASPFSITAPLNVNSGGTLTLSGTNNIAANTTNINVATGGAIVFSGTGFLNNNGTFTLNTGASLTTSQADGIAATGATGGVRSSGIRTFNTGANYTFNGTTAQNTGTGFTGGATVTFNNTAGVTLTSAATVSTLLNLSAGIVSIGNNNLTVSAGTAGAISGGSSTAYVLVNGTGTLLRQVNAGSGNFVFPVGAGGAYSPVALNITGNLTPRNLGVRVIATAHPNNSPAPEFANRYWTISNSLAGSFTFTPTFTINDPGDLGAGSFSNMRINRWNGTLWTEFNSTPSTTFSTPNYSTTAALDQTSLSNATVNEFAIRINPPTITYSWDGSASSDWGDPDNWTPFTGLTPGSVDNVIVGDIVYTNELDITGTRSILDLSVINTGEFNMSAGSSLTINGGFTYSSSATSTFNCTSTLAISGTGSQNVPAFNYGNLNISGGARVLAGSGTIGICGTFTPGSGPFTIAGSTVDFNGTGIQTVPAFSFENLTISGVRTTNNVTLSAAVVNVAGVFSPAAAFTSGNYITTGNTIQYNGPNGQIIVPFNYNNLSSTNNNRVLSNSGNIGIAGIFTPGTGVYTTTGSTVVYNGTGAQTIPSFTTAVAGRSYHNLTIEGTGLYTPTRAWTGGSNGITGKMTLNGGDFQQTTTGGGVTFTINGDLEIANSNARFTQHTGSLSTNNTFILGNFIQSAGRFDFAVGTGTGSGFAYLAGNHTATGGIINTASPNAPNGVFVFNGTAPQTYSRSAGGFVFVNVTINSATASNLQLLSNLTVQDGNMAVGVNATLDAQNFTVTVSRSSGTRTFNLNNNSTLRTARVGGVAGTISLLGGATATYNTGANYVFTGTNQSTGFTTTPLISTVNSITWLGNTAIDLDRSVAVTSQFNFTNNGLFRLGNNNLTISVPGSINGAPFGVNKMFVTNGTGYLIINSSNPSSLSITYPIGEETGTTEYSPVTISFTGNPNGGVGFRVVDDVVHPQMGLATNYLNRYWNSTTTFPSYNWTGSFTYTASDIVGVESAIRLNIFDPNPPSSGWTEFPASSASANVLTVTSGPGTGTLNNTDIAGRTNVATYYRSVSTGPWATASNWEVSTDPAFVSPAPVPAGVAPNNANSQGILIRSPHVITIGSTVWADDITVQSGGTLTVGALGNFTLSNGPAANDLVVDGALNINSTTVFQLGSNTVINGTATNTTLSFSNNGLGTATVSNGAIYTHNVTGGGGSCLVATWQTGSLLRVQGTNVTAPPGLLNQNFYDVEWNATHTANVNLSSAQNFTTIANNLTILNTGSFDLRLFTASATGTTNIGGNLTVSGGTLAMANGGTANAGVFVTLNVTGNVLINGGVLSLSGAGQPNAANSTLNIGGNLTISSGRLDFNTSAGGSPSIIGVMTVNLSGNLAVSGTGTIQRTTNLTNRGLFRFNSASGTQTLTGLAASFPADIDYMVGNGTTSPDVVLGSNFIINNNSRLTVRTNGTLVCADNFAVNAATSGNGAFTLESGGTLVIGSPDGITTFGNTTGSIRTGNIAANRVFNTAANYTYASTTSNQVTGTGLPTSHTGILRIENTGAASNNTVTLTTTGSTGSTLQLAAGLFAIGSGQTYNIASGGTVAASGGDFALGVDGGTLNFPGSGTFSGNCNPFNVFAAGGVNFGSGTVTIQNNGRFRINAGGFVATNAPFYAVGSTLEYFSGGAPSSAYGRGLEWSAASGRGFPHHVRIDNNTNLNPAGGSGANAGVVFQTGGDVTITAGSAIFKDWSGFNMTADFIIGGNLELSGSLSGSQASGSDIFIRGNWNNSGTAANFFNNGRAVFFDGTAAQVLSGTNTASNPFAFLIVNNSAGLTLSTTLVEVNNQLTFTNGLITLGNTDLRMNNLNAAVTGASATRYIVTNGTGRFIRNFNTVNGATLFPIGPNASDYSPATLTQNGTNDNIGIRVSTAPPFTNAVNDDAFMVNLEYNFNETTPGGNNLTTTFQWPASLEAGSFVRSNSVYHGDWTGTTYQIRVASATTGSNPYVSTAVGYTGSISNRNFVLGNLIGILPCITTATGGEWTTPGTWTSGIIPPTGSNACITHPVTVTTADPNDMNGVTINPGGSLTLAGTRNLNFVVGGVFDNNSGSVLNLGAGSVSLLGSGSIGGSNAMQFTSLFLSGATTLTTAPTINGTLHMNNGSAVSGSSPVYATNSTLRYSTAGAFTPTLEWSGNGTTAGSGIPHDVEISTGTVLNMPNSNRGLAGNLLISNGTLNLNGTSGDLFIAGNWTRAAASVFNPNNRAVVFNGSANQSIAVTGGGTETFAFLLSSKPSGNLVISSSPATNVTVNASVGNVLQLASNNTIDLNGRTLILSGTGGNINLLGGTSNIIGGAGSLLSISGGTKTVTPNAGATLSFGSNVTVALNSGLNFGPSTSTVNGTLQIALGGFVQTNAPTYASGSTLRYFTGNAFNRGPEWSTNSGPGYPFNVVVDQNGTVTTVNLQPGSGVCQIAGNLTINNGASVNMGNMGIPLNVRGSVAVGGALSGSLTLSTAIGGDLQVGGNLTRNAGGSFTQFSREVEMNGTVTQDIFNFASFSLLAINNSVAPVRINNNTSISERLRLASGTFNLNGFTTTMANNSMVLRANGVMTASPTVVGADQYDMRYDASVTTSVEYLVSATAIRDLIVSSGVTVTLGADRTFNRNLELAGGNLDLGGFTMTARGRTAAPAFSGSITVTGGGTRSVNGPAGSRFNITGLGTNSPLDYTKTVSTFGGTQLSFGSNVLVAIGDGAVDFGVGSPTTINGVLQVLLGGSVGQVLNPCVYAPGSILRFANTVDYQVGPNDKTWATGSIASGLPGIPFNVEVNDVGTDLTLQDTRALRGNLTITNGSFTLAPAYTGSFNIGGNWTRTGATSTFVHNNKEVSFDRQTGGNQTITTSGVIGGGETFFDLEVSPVGGDLLLGTGTALTVRGTLNFITGRFDIGANQLTIGTSTLNGSITGVTPSRYIISTGGSGSVRQFTNLNAVDYLFPVGDATNYSPFTVTLDNGAQAGSFITTTLFTISHPNAVGSTHYLNRYWRVEPTGLAASPVYDVEFTYAAADIVGTETTYRPVKYTSSTPSPGWISAPGSGANAIDGTAANFDLPTKTFTWENLTTFSEFTAAGDGSPLPVELLDFSADVAGNTVVLNWTTASEINNDYFTVERSVDALNFAPIGTVDGAGNSSLTRNYQLIDANPLPGVSYYRLRQTDFNGDFELFGPVAVNFSGSSLTGVALFPNPANEFSHVMINANHSGKGWVRVTDIAGRLVANYQIVMEKGVTPFTLQTSDLAPGQYMVSVETADGKLYNLPLIKQ